jgi:Fe-S cluster biogenesis protein NfuA
MPDDLKLRVQSIVQGEAAAALQIDGTALEVIDVEDGVVRIRVGGACAACPATVMSLIMGLEHEIRQRIPEIEYLEAVP